MEVLSKQEYMKIQVNNGKKLIPDCPSSLSEFTTEIDDVELTCHMDFEEGDSSVGLEDSVSVYAAYAGGPVDIVSLLSRAQIREIELNYFEYMEENSEDYY
jgi:hypothetical protein